MGILPGHKIHTLASLPNVRRKQSSKSKKGRKFDQIIKKKKFKQIISRRIISNRINTISRWIRKPTVRAIRKQKWLFPWKKEFFFKFYWPALSKKAKKYSSKSSAEGLSATESTLSADESENQLQELSTTQLSLRSSKKKHNFDLNELKLPKHT